MKEYRCRKNEIWFNTFTAALFWGIIFVANGNPTKTWLVNLGFFAFGLIGFAALIKSLVKVTIDDYSINIKYPFRPEKKINFNEIASLGDSGSAQKLILKDINGRKLAVIGKNLKGIHELKEEVKKRIPKNSKPQYRDYFRKSNSFFFSFIFFNGIGLAAIILSISRNRILPALLLLFIYGLIIYIVGKQFIFIRLNYNSITLKSFFRTVEYSMNEVEKLSQEADRESSPTADSYLVIKPKEGKEISLTGFAPDDELLYLSAKHYYENQKRYT